MLLTVPRPSKLEAPGSPSVFVRFSSVLFPLAHREPAKRAKAPAFDRGYSAGPLAIILGGERGPIILFWGLVIADRSLQLVCRLVAFVTRIQQTLSIYFMTPEVTSSG